MLIVPVVLFAVAAVGGIVLAGIRRRGSNPPLALSIVHGVVAAAGLVALIVAGVQGGLGGYVGISLGLFVVAALGGFVLIATHLRGRLIPFGLVGVHAAVAVAAYVFLLLAAF